MPHGVQTAIATAEKVSDAYVTAVMNGTITPKSPAAKRKLRRVQVALARMLDLRVDEAFPQTEQEAPRPRAKAS